MPRREHEHPCHFQLESHTLHQSQSAESKCRMRGKRSRDFAPPVRRHRFRNALAGAIGARLGVPRLAQAASGAPVPIPGGSPALGGSYHVFGPAAFDPIDAEPITITDFNGAVGLAYISGMVTQTNTTTNQVTRLPFVDSDMRFMQGVFRGTDGRIHQGAFAFI